MRHKPYFLNLRDRNNRLQMVNLEAIDSIDMVDEDPATLKVELHLRSGRILTYTGQSGLVLTELIRHMLDDADPYNGGGSADSTQDAKHTVLR
jgi:hypothetical protein